MKTADRLELTSPRRLETRDDGGVTLHFDGLGLARQCGDCRLCCKLVPVAEMHKPAGERCRYSKAGKGCVIYSRRPGSCVVWSCRWLIDPMAADLVRPDRSHYTIDMDPDYVELRNDDTGEIIKVSVVQVWVDPNYRRAADDPALLRYLEKLGDYGFAALIRFSERDGYALFPPSMSSDRQWHKHTGETVHRERNRWSIHGKTVPEPG